MITPIETEYAGCRFRSRLEARWAVAFDTLGIAWEYEPQGYEVGPDKRPYLPDFWLPKFDSGTWVEVKGAPEQLDAGLLEAAVGRDGLGRSDAHGETKILILGPIPEPGPAYTHTVISASRLPHCVGMCNATHPVYTRALLRGWPKEKPTGYEVTDDVWRALTDMGGLLVQWGRQHPRATDMHNDGDLVTARPNLMIIPDLPVQAAYRAARRARFEHGESGAA